VTRILVVLALFGLAQSPGPAAPGRDQSVCAPAGSVSVSLEGLPADPVARELLPVPGTVPRPGLASPTRAPWINTNGSRFLRSPGAKYRYDLPEGKGALAAAEALAYAADAALQIVPGDLPAVCRMFAFAKEVPTAQLPDVVDIGVVDDGSAILGEVMNLLVRRNLLFQLVPAPQARFPVNVALGTPDYTVAEAADPSAFALKIRRRLTDERRALRLFGSEVVIGRLTGDGRRVRLHLLNYGNREIAGLRLRVRGTYRNGEAYVADQGRVALDDYAVSNGFTEFSLPRLTAYGIVDLR
jgi:hypothetical protein